MIQISINFHKTTKRNAKKYWHAKITEIPDGNRKKTKNITTKKSFGRPSQQIGIVSRGHTSSPFTAAAK